MSYCNRTSVSNSCKIRLLDKDNNETKNDLFEEVRCKKKAVSDGACYDCLSKEENNKKIHKINAHKLYDKEGKRIWQSRVIHRKGDGPLPAWSQIKGGEWYNSMLKNGFRTESDMAPTKKEENVVVKTKRAYKKKESNTSNVIVEIKEKMYIDNTAKEEASEIVKIEVSPITIKGEKYYYDKNKNKVYTLQYDYVGRYDTKNEILHTEYPDSDTEPSF